MCSDVDEFSDLGLALAEVVIVVKEEVWNPCGNGDNVDRVACGAAVRSSSVVFLCVVRREVTSEAWATETAALFGFCRGSSWLEGIVLLTWKFVQRFGFQPCAGNTAKPEAEGVAAVEGPA